MITNDTVLIFGGKLKVSGTFFLSKYGWNTSPLFGGSFACCCHIFFQPCLAEAANDIGPKLTYSFAACRVAMGTYPASKPCGGFTIKAGSISASFPILGGAR